MTMDAVGTAHLIFLIVHVVPIIQCFSSASVMPAIPEFGFSRPDLLIETRSTRPTRVYRGHGAVIRGPAGCHHQTSHGGRTMLPPVAKLQTNWRMLRSCGVQGDAV